MELALSYVLLLCGIGYGGGLHEVTCLRKENIAFFRGDHPVFGSRVKEVDIVEVRLRSSKGGHRCKGVVLMRTVDLVRCEYGAVELLVQLRRTQGEEGVPSSLLLWSLW